MRTPLTRLTRSAAGLAATAAILITLAGCAAPTETGGSPGDSGGGAAMSDADFSAARDAYDLKLAQCLRDKGLDVKDPAPGQGIQESGEEINAAASDCMKEVGDPPVWGGQVDEAEMLETYLEWAECFRGLGYEIEDPTNAQAFTVPETATEEDMATCMDSTP